MNITILVATHKRYWMPSDKIYLPLHVGAEGKAPLPYTPDNTGENISSKNPNYCEITGLYWAWKNLTTDYIGLCHYRRYFGKSVYTNDILFAAEKKIDLSQRRDYQARIFGFLAERLFNVWLEKKQLRVAEAAIISLESIHWGKKITRFLMRKFLR